MTDVSSNLPPHTLTLHALPYDLLCYILSQLPIRDILSCTETCRTIRDVGRDEFLWKELAQRNLSAALLSSKSESESWFEFCKQYLGTRAWGALIPQLLAASVRFHRIFKKKNRRTIKIAIFGNDGVGKTTLTIRFTCGLFVCNYDPTNTDSFRRQFEVCQPFGWILIKAD